MSHIEKMKKARRLSDLELFEIVVAAYPERFEAREEAGDDIWDEVLEFVENELCGELLQDEQGLRELLGRILLLTHPVQAALSGKLFHALGKVEIHDNAIHMLGGAKAEIVLEKAAATENRWPCWSCKKPVSAEERAAADGECPHCRAVLVPALWPAKSA